MAEPKHNRSHSRTRMAQAKQRPFTVTPAKCPVCHKTVPAHTVHKECAVSYRND